MENGELRMENECGMKRGAPFIRIGNFRVDFKMVNAHTIM